MVILNRLFAFDSQGSDSGLCTQEYIAPVCMKSGEEMTEIKLKDVSICIFQLFALSEITLINYNSVNTSSLCKVLYHKT